MIVAFSSALIAFAMQFDSYELGVESRREHMGDVMLGLVLAVILPFATMAVTVFLIDLFGMWLPLEIVKNKYAIGAVLSATDPVFVSAMMVFQKNKETHAAKKMAIRLQTESLGNDPVALFLYQYQTGHINQATLSIVYAVLISVAIFIIVAIVLVKTKNRHLSTIVRLITFGIAMVIGSKLGAATISIAVIGGLLIGYLEAPYHHESHEKLEQTVFRVGLFVLIVSSALAFSPIASGFFISITTSIVAGLIILLQRVISRAGGIGLLKSGVREFCIGGAGAIGVPAIIVTEMMSKKEYLLANFIAGASVFSLIFFAVPTYILFSRYGHRDRDL